MATNPNKLPPQVERVCGLDSIGADLRTLHGRRWRDHVRHLAEQLGNEPTASQGLLLRRCATLNMFLESAEAKMLAGQEVDEAAFVRNANAMQNILIKLGLASKSRDITKGDSETADDHAAMVLGESL
jgi:hypothetical protein